MQWQVAMEDDGTVSLPSDLIAKLGWIPKTPLRLMIEDGGILLGPVDASDSVDRP